MAEWQLKYSSKTPTKPLLVFSACTQKDERDSLSLLTEWKQSSKGVKRKAHRESCREFKFIASSHYDPSSIILTECAVPSSLPLLDSPTASFSLLFAYLHFEGSSELVFLARSHIFSLQQTYIYN